MISAELAHARNGTGALPRRAAVESGRDLVAEDNLIDRLLADQHRLQTPVALFARRHEQGLRTDLFRHLIPLEQPRPGEQYAFEVDLDKCSGCKACVSACHSLNGLDAEEAWRDVGLLLGERAGRPYQQTVTTACHHCLEPACAHGCPVLAYEKDESTGIVRHLDDQCIGCSYCVLKCPYDVPKFSATRGIVRKCDMCHSRLSAGEAPACVQACPHEAIRIVTVSRHTVRERAELPLVPGAFDSHYTRPTTYYAGSKAHAAGSAADEPARAAFTQLRPADARSLRVEEAHSPLAVMLVLTQFALGVSLAAWLGDSTALWVAALGLAGMGGAASVLHLGQPLKAWRVFLGLRRSWLSREVVAFGPWVGLLGLAASLAVIEASWLRFSLPDWLRQGEGALLTAAVGPAALVMGAVVIFCSMMVYIDTRRALWSAPRTVFRFGSTVVLGFVAGWACLEPSAVWLAASAVLLKLAVEVITWRRWSGHAAESPTARSAAIMLRKLPWTTAFRVGSALAAAGLFFIHPVAAAAVLVAAEIAERRLFFQACPAPRMPGL